MGKRSSLKGRSPALRIKAGQTSGLETGLMRIVTSPPLKEE
jgi:hypothetical protein